MSKSSSGWNGADQAQIPIRKFRDFDVSWAGQGRRSGEFCFGSEDGRILITDEHLKPVEILKESSVPSGDAVNGLAFMNDLIAISTRCEVCFISPETVNGRGFRAVFPAGAHGVIATPSGYFVAPLGRSGLMVVKPSAGEDQPLTIKGVSQKPINFYKVVNIPCAGGEVLACAARLDGMAAMPFSSDGTEFVSSLTYPGLDVVDVCSLGQNLPTPAIAAISRDCTLILSRDAIHDPTPTTIKFEEIKGVAYRVLNYNGNLLLLTSKAVYVLAGLSRRFLNKEPISVKPTPVKAIVLEAVDANIGDDRSLLVVVPDGVISIDLDLLIGAVSLTAHPDEAQEVSPTAMSPQWQPQKSGLESESRMMASVG
jgi:hypothetical protein